MPPRKPKSAVPTSMVGAAIRRHREAINWTVAKLADEIDVSRNTLTNYELGKTEPSASELSRLADKLGCSIMELLGVGAPATTPRFAFRAHAAHHKDPKVAVFARKLTRRYVEIETITETRLCDRLRPFVCSTTSALGDREIEALAEELRQSSGLHDCGPENIAAVLESLGVRCLFFDFDSPGLDGISAVDGDTMITLLPNSGRNVERIIFSAAHELGHLVLHPFLFTESGGSNLGERDFEKEANIFAGAFLVPSTELARIWREDRLDRLPLPYALLNLKRTFRISYWALFYRLRALHLTDFDYPHLISHTKRYMGISGKTNIADLEPEPFESQFLFRTSRFELLVRSAFIQDLIGTTKVAEMLDITVDEAQSKTTEWRKPKFANADGQQAEV